MRLAPGSISDAFARGAIGYAALACAVYVVTTFVFVVMMSLHDPRQLAGTAAIVLTGAGLWGVRRSRT